MTAEKHIPLTGYRKCSADEMMTRSKTFIDKMTIRRTVRDFSSDSFPIEIIENCIRAAGSAPSGANQQPWHFVIVSNAGVKKEIREAAEAEEREFYSSRAPQEWLEALSPLGTDSNKPFLESAPYLIALFEKKYDDTGNEKRKFYYTKESVGIASGILITALHECGLVSLTHTPSPMNFLNGILNRPVSEKPFLLIVTGFPAEGVTVPDIKRKKLDEISSRFI